MIDHVSYSMISLWNRCRECWKYKYVMGLEGEEPEVYREGKEYHEQVHSYHTGQEYDEEWLRPYTRSHRPNYRIKSEIMIKDENMFDLPFVGRLDGIGDGFLTDLKYVSRRLSQKQADDSLQATMYLYWYWTTSKKHIPFYFDCVNKKNGKVSVVRTTRTDKDFAELKNTVSAFVKEVKKAIKENDFSPAGPGCYPGCCEYIKICENCQ